MDNEFKLFQRSGHSIWTDPYISRQLLAAHLDQSNDMVSRNPKVIDRTIRWILRGIPRKASVLDLGCGPGLYSQKLAGMGYRVTGVDINAESIKYARLKDKRRSVRYIHGDYLKARLEGSYDLIVMIYCDFGALIPKEQELILKKARSLLKKDRILVFDVFGTAIARQKEEIRTWSHSTGSDFWSKDPHWILEEVRHFPKASAVGSRYVLIPEKAGKTKEFIMWDQYYTKRKIREFVGRNGFAVEKIAENLVRSNQFASDDVLFIKTRKKA